MALDPGPRRAPRRARWAYMRIGYKQGGRTRTGRARGAPVYRWVRVGSPFFRTLKSRGVRPTATSARRMRPGTRPVQPSPDTRDRLGGGRGRQGRRGPERFTRSRRYERIRERNLRPDPKKRRKGAGGGAGGGKGRRGGGRGAGGFVGALRATGVNNPKALSPAKVARARTALQFGPLIAEIKRQQERTGREKDQNLADIAAYYDEVEDKAATGRQANEAASEAALSDFDAAVGGLAALFGGGANPASGGAAAQAVGLRAMLQGTGLAQAGFDNEFEAILGQQETDQKLRETRYQDAIGAELADRLIQARLDRGNALTANRAQAEMEALQRLAQIQNMQLAAQEFNLNYALGVEQLKSARQNRRLQRLEVDEALKEKAGGGWSAIKDDPAAMAGLRNQLLAPGFVVGSGGGLLVGPAKAINAMGDALRSLGLDPRRNKEVRRFRDNVFRQILTQTHARGSWRKFQIKGNKLVHTPSGTVIYTFR